MLDQCCDYGSKYSFGAKVCSNDHLNMPREIPSNLHKLCRANIKFCCEKSRQTIHCHAGKKWAKSQPNCDQKNQSEMFKVILDATRKFRDLKLLTNDFAYFSFSFAATFVKLVNRLRLQVESVTVQLGTY